MKPKFYYYGVHKNLDPTLSPFNTDSGILTTVHWGFILIFDSPPPTKKSFKWSPAFIFSETFLCNKRDLQFQILSIHPSTYSMINPKIIKFLYEYDVIIIGIS